MKEKGGWLSNRLCLWCNVCVVSHYMETIHDDSCRTTTTTTLT